MQAFALMSPVAGSTFALLPELLELPAALGELAAPPESPELPHAAVATSAPAVTTTAHSRRAEERTIMRPSRSLLWGFASG